MSSDNEQKQDDEKDKKVTLEIEWGSCERHKVKKAIEVQEGHKSYH